MFNKKTKSKAEAIPFQKPVLKIGYDQLQPLTVDEKLDKIIDLLQKLMQ